MALSPLDNLVRIGQLKAEPRNVHEAARMLAMARTRLADARLGNVSLEGRFTSAYNAAHAAALAALRWQGYRSENRYTVFQWPCPHRRLAGQSLAGVGCRAPKKRNLAEYEGYLDVHESTVDELCAVAAQLIGLPTIPPLSSPSSPLFPPLPFSLFSSFSLPPLFSPPPFPPLTPLFPPFPFFPPSLFFLLFPSPSLLLFFPFPPSSSSPPLPPSFSLFPVNSRGSTSLPAGRAGPVARNPLICSPHHGG